MSTLVPNSIAILIPAFNEEATIAEVVQGAMSLGKVIVINDGSSDGTEQCALDAGAWVLNLSQNTGYEGALSAGFQFALNRDFAFALTLDADGQHPIDAAKAVIESMGDADIVVGVRQKKQRISEFIAGWIAKKLWGISDPFSGLKLYRLESCKSLGKFDTRKLVGTEMLSRAYREDLFLNSVSIDTVNRLDQPRIGNSFKANLKILRATFLFVAISWGLIS